MRAVTFPSLIVPGLFGLSSAEQRLQERVGEDAVLRPVGGRPLPVVRLDLDEDGNQQDVTSNDVNAYLREITGDEITAKINPLHSGAEGGSYQPLLIKFKDGTPVAAPK